MSDQNATPETIVEPTTADTNAVVETPAAVTPAVDPLAAALELLAAQAGISVADIMARLTAPVAPVTTAPKASAPKAAAPKAAKTEYPGESKERFVSADDPFAKLFGITGKDGQFISRSYCKAYVECNCRPDDGFVDQPTMTRKQLFDYFSGNEYLTEAVAAGCRTGAAIGKRAAADPRWNRTPKATGKTSKPAAKPAAAPAPAPVTPVTDIALAEALDPEAAAFAAAAAPAALPTDAQIVTAPIDVVPAISGKTQRDVDEDRAARAAARQRIAAANAALVAPTAG